MNITLRRTIIALSFLMLSGIMIWAAIRWSTESDPLAYNILRGVPMCAIFGYVSTRLILHWSDS